MQRPQRRGHEREQQLLGLGAPAALVRASLDAAADEVAHARLAYGLASAYGGAALGPGQLGLAGVEIDASWRAVVRGLIKEACVGETLGVVEALAAAEQARAELRGLLTRIAADEQRHAALAWRCLAWLLGGAEAGEQTWALDLLDATISSWRPPTTGRARPRDGVVAGPARARLHREAIRELLEPLAASVRASHASASS